MTTSANNRAVEVTGVPTYEYRCDTCGTVVEAVQGFHDAPLTQCPSCDGTLKKRFGNVGVVFKGSGFYRNDARAERKGGGAQQKPDTKPKTEGDAPSSSAGKAQEKSAPAKESGSSTSGSGKSTSTA